MLFETSSLRAAVSRRSLVLLAETICYDFWLIVARHGPS